MKNRHCTQIPANIRLLSYVGSKEAETVQYGNSFYSNDTADISQAKERIRSVLSQ